MRKDELSGFENAYTESIKEPEKFWFTAAQEIDWFKTPTKTLDISRSEEHTSELQSQD